MNDPGPSSSEVSGPASLAAWLSSGGDRRIALDPGTGLNRYGCSSIPDPLLKSYGSSTASTISPKAFAAAENLYQRLDLSRGRDLGFPIYEKEFEKIRVRLSNLFGLSSLPGTDIIFGASGTDLHRFAAHITAIDSETLHVVFPEPEETGCDVPPALEGKALSDNTPRYASAGKIKLSSVALRLPNGEARSKKEIDDETESAVVRALDQGQRVLLIVTDLSKTGLWGPSPELAQHLKRRFFPKLEVFVDACQFRLSRLSLKNYLQRDFLVAITGSKFVTGPAFSGALLVPPEASLRLRIQSPDKSLNGHSSRADWPQSWKGRGNFSKTHNIGLLLRWEAALEELDAFCQIPEKEIEDFLRSFATVVTQKLKSDPAFEPLSIPDLDRISFNGTPSWDSIPTMFPFMLRNKTLLDPQSTSKIHQGLHLRHCEIGQPAKCGNHEGEIRTALRLCLGMRQVVDALSAQGRGVDAIQTEALGVLDEIAQASLLYPF